MRIVIPVGAPLKAALDAAKIGKGPEDHILLNSDGQPWTPDGFRSSSRKACAAAGVTNLTFHDLRGTAVTRLAIAGCTEAEIATLTGRSPQDMRMAFMPTMYTVTQHSLAAREARRGNKSPKCSHKCPNCSALFSSRNWEK